MPLMGVALFAHINSHMHHGRVLIKKSLREVRFFHMRPSRSGFDCEREAFRAELILKTIKQVGFICRIGFVIMNALIDRMPPLSLSYNNN